MPPKHICEAQKWFYQDSVDELRRMFNRLTLIVEGEAAIRFIDPVVFSICLPLWDTDGDGYISDAEAKIVKRFIQGVFNGQEGITSLDDLDKLAGYVYHAGDFYNMPNLVTATTGLKINLTSGLPDTFTASYANCPKLERIKINKTITLISNGAFSGDVSLTTVIFGGNETKIGNQSFMGCTSLEHIELPKSITELSYNSFRNCSALNAINLGNVITFGSACFASCSKLNIDVNMPNATGEISQVFSDSGIISVSNLGKVTSITYFAFGSCPNLRYVVLPETLTSIGNATFYNSSKIEYIVCQPTTPPTLDGSAFNGTSCIIYVPDASVNAYKTATNWSKFASRIKAISEKS